MSPLTPYFAPRLTVLLDAATPASVPWQASPGDPETCAARIDGADDIIGVLVTLTYRATDGRTWSDTLNLKRTPMSWRINNLFHAEGGNLRFRLREQP